MKKRGSASRALHRAQQKGMAVVADIGPSGVKNCPVEYAPRSIHDPQPWRPVDGPYWLRLKGTECKAVLREADA